MTDYDIPEADDFGPFHVELAGEQFAVYDAYVQKYSLYYPTIEEARAVCRALLAASEIGYEELDAMYSALRIGR